jgi:hypothetical protein
MLKQILLNKHYGIWTGTEILYVVSLEDKFHETILDFFPPGNIKGWAESHSNSRFQYMIIPKGEISSFTITQNNPWN